MRKKKWPLIITVPLCIGLMGAIILRQIPHKNKKIVNKQEISSLLLKTWSDFDEYKRLQMLVEGFNIKTMIDIPSQDLETLKQNPFGIKNYLGVTESGDQAKAFQACYGSKLKTFFHSEITIDLLPQADLILCWDKLCTLSPSQIRAALLQFKKSGAKFLLMRHYPTVQQNKKNRTGEIQPINWKLAPYDFPEPIIQIIENKKNSTRCLALWSLESI